MHYGRFPHTLPTDLPTYPSDTPFRHTLLTHPSDIPLKHHSRTYPSDIPFRHTPSNIPFRHTLPPHTFDMLHKLLSNASPTVKSALLGGAGPIANLHTIAEGCFRQREARCFLPVVLGAHGKVQEAQQSQHGLLSKVSAS